MKQYELDYVKAKLLDTYKIDIKTIEATEEGNIKITFAFEKDTNKTESTVEQPYGASIESNITVLENAIKETCNKIFLLDDVEG